MFKSKKMRGFLGVVIVLMVGVTAWLILAKPSVVSNQDKTETAKTDKKETTTKNDNKPAEKQVDNADLTMPNELTTTGGVSMVAPVALAGVAFSGAAYVRSKKATF